MASLGDSSSTIAAIVLAVILIIGVPLVTLTQRNDNVVQENTKLITDSYVKDIVNTGKMTRARYQEFVDELAATGTYDIEIEVQKLDENPGKKTAQVNYTKIGENMYVTETKTQIEEEWDTLDGVINLSEGDIVSVKLKNADSTANQNLMSSIFSFSNAGEDAITASSSGMVTAKGADR